MEEGQDPDVLKHAGKVPENLKAVKEEEIVVWVDPVDGTAEYTQGGYPVAKQPNNFNLLSTGDE